MGAARLVYFLRLQDAKLHLSALRVNFTGRRRLIDDRPVALNDDTSVAASIKVVHVLEPTLFQSHLGLVQSHMHYRWDCCAGSAFEEQPPLRKPTRKSESTTVTPLGVRLRRGADLNGVSSQAGDPPGVSPILGFEHGDVKRSAAREA